ncbi:apelin receptor early endogenous ligand [Trichosurus vulpecula]|uniref:apelin receptor early endogenous ligand n=1 Tax=Trichosurus vulpecula TaxID=9337 RepID=UPI00186AD391|nr:apelin receptor early endogenous ligand [Trichosurus vulpecula]
MRFQLLFFLFLFFTMGILLINGQRPGNLALRRKPHRHICPQRRCMPLHSRVPFP